MGLGRYLGARLALFAIDNKQLEYLDQRWEARLVAELQIVSRDVYPHVAQRLELEYARDKDGSLPQEYHGLQAFVRDTVDYANEMDLDSPMQCAVLLGLLLEAEPTPESHAQDGLGPADASSAAKQQKEFEDQLIATLNRETTTGRAKLALLENWLTKRAVSDPGFAAMQDRLRRMQDALS